MAGVIVQTLCTRWTKQSRGAPASARRNSTPEQVVLDPARVLDEGVTWHEVTFDEPEFILREAYRERSLPNDFLRASVFFEHDHTTLSVRFFGSVRLRLTRRQSGRILYNLSDDTPIDGWYQTTFQKVIVQVAFGLAPQTHLFSRTPDQQHVSMRDLT
jgi:hypothetical protein